MPEYSITIEGTPEEVQALLNVGSKVEPRFCRKKRISPGKVVLWYKVPEGENAPNDLLAAMKRRAGLTKPKARKAKKVDDASTGEPKAAN